MYVIVVGLYYLKCPWKTLKHINLICRQILVNVKDLNGYKEAASYQCNAGLNAGLHSYAIFIGTRIYGDR